VGPSLGPTRMHPDHEHLRRLEARRVRAPRGRGDAASAQGTKKPRLAGLSQCAREDSNLHELSAHEALNLEHGV